MSKWKLILPAATLLLLAGQAAAQSEEEERQRALEAREVAMEERLRAAEARMAEAAREIAEITKERLPRMAEIEKRFAWSSKPMIGINIEGDRNSGPVEGVLVTGVSPGGAANDAGLRSGDVGDDLGERGRKREHERADEKSAHAHALGDLVGIRGKRRPRLDEHRSAQQEDDNRLPQTHPAPHSTTGTLSRHLTL